MIWLILIIIAAISYLAVQYNKAQSLAQSVKEAHSNITVTLKKRLDLVNKLIDIARSYGEHEKLTYIAVVEGESLGALAQASLRADNTITQLNNLSRNYPELKANQTYMRLMDDLHKIESLVQDRREKYNAGVRIYNTFCNSIPFVFIAPSLGFPQAPYFDVSNADELENLKDFVTDDGALLRQKLAGAGAQVAQTTRVMGNKLEANSRVLLEKGKEEIQRRRQGAVGSNHSEPTQPDEPVGE
ncbi:LemA protein [Fibrisoma limi BUZ 3]|uniref:LemA protein n=1 Tax=Fibrisoma limi BUZ 3 TaxID=1185876 RepID=I2GFZ8_9BACT|nr:LemA family protein [Fibrisoma limi]CCH52823.1 LemA protein [Fibrisoma limi BUZ 3]